VRLLSLAFEAVNAFLLVAIFAAACFFGAWIWRRVKAGARWDDLNLAAALLIFLVGDLIIRAPVWWYRHGINHGDVITQADLTAFTVAVCVGAAIGCVGMLYLLNASTPERARPWPAVATFLGACGFMAVVLWK
jgi:hypothetical protein